jgi:hypothetical protein
MRIPFGYLALFISLASLLAPTPARAATFTVTNGGARLRACHSSDTIRSLIK